MHRLVTLVTLLAACGGTDGIEGSGGGGVGGGGEGGGDVAEPLEVADCGADAIALVDGSCLAVGVDDCGAGFMPDSVGGCVPVIPEGDCSLGAMKILGEPACVEVSPCSGKWGSAPIDANTVFVDASYSGGASNGSETNPYVDLQTALDLAPSGATVAIAAGDYGWAEINETVRLWGACPDAVTIHGDVAAPLPVGLFIAAPGVEVHALSVTDAAWGLVVVAPDALIEGVVVHDLGNYGIWVDGDYAPDASAHVKRTSIVRVTGSGLNLSAGEGTVEDVHIADVQSYSDGTGGRAIGAFAEAAAPSLTVDGLVIEHSKVAGMLLFGAMGAVSRVYVGGTQGYAGGGRGEGITIDDVPNNSGDNFPPDVTLTQVAIDGAFFYGLKVEDGDVLAQDLTIRNIVADPTFPIDNGQGLYQIAWTEPTSLTLDGALIENVTSTGLFVGSAGAANGGNAVATADLTSLSVRDVATAKSGLYGYGIYAQGALDVSAQSQVTVTDARVERSATAGIAAIDANLDLSRAQVVETGPNAKGEYGDGVMIHRYFVGAAPLFADLRGLVVQGSARVGVGNFGADVRVEDATLACNLIALNGEANAEGIAFTFDALGNNRCGCGLTEPCKVLSTGIAPPPLLP